MAESPTFGWAESPSDYKWHCITGAGTGEPLFNAACGESFQPTRPVDDDMPHPELVCPVCLRLETQARNP